MKNRIFLTVLFAVFSVLSAPVFSEIRIISPEEGSWCNTQSLVIETTEGEDVYYSFSGADPLTSGFAYDGPVMLDVCGDVELRVVSIDKNAKRRNLKVNYSVELLSSENEENKTFIDELSKAPVIEYASGDRLEIPFNMKYALGEPSSWDQGRPLYTAKNSVLERYVPLYLTDGSVYWRFVVHTVPSVSGELSVNEVPFTFNDWTELNLSDRKTLYKLDDQWWEGGGKIIEIDRSISHTLYWQSAAYGKENQVSSCIIPPQVQAKKKTLSDGSVLVKLVNSNGTDVSPEYRFTCGENFSGTYTEALFDIFQGDRFVSPVKASVYYEGIYQGTVTVQMELNRRKPEAPVISTSCEAKYSRENVIVAASGKKGLKLFYSVSGPVEVKSGFDMPDISQIDFPSSDFEVYTKEPVEFFADTEKVLAYRFRVYGIDEWGNTSGTSEYSVIIDKYNFYVDSEASDLEVNDGSPFAPYKNLDGIAECVNSRDFTRFVIKGKTFLPRGEIFLTSNVEFTAATEQAEVLFPENTVMVLSNAGLYAQNVIFEKNPDEEASGKKISEKLLKNMFILQHSAATLKDCQVISVFLKDGFVFNASSSALNLSGTGVSLKASGYGSLVSLSDSKLNLENSELSCVTNTAMVISAKKSEIFSKKTKASLSARVGRIAELISTKARFVHNAFTVELSTKVKDSEMLWKDEKSKVEAIDANTLNGEPF